jgi:hypothetical protein
LTSSEVSGTSAADGLSDVPPATLNVPNSAEQTSSLSSTEPEGSPSGKRWLSIVPWSALAATFIVTLRILSVAHLNTQVALRLVQLTDVAQVLLGLAIVVFPTMVVVAALYVHLGCIYALTDMIKSARTKVPMNPPPRALAFFLLWPPLAAMAIAFVPLFPGLLILIGVMSITVVWVTRGSSTAAANR